MMLRAALFSVLWLAAATAHAAEDLPALVERILAAYGGETALAQGNPFRQQGRIVSAQGGPERVVTRVFQRPDRLRLEIVGPTGAREVRVLDGTAGWKDGAPASRTLHAAMQLQAARLALPLLLRERQGALSERGQPPAPGESDLRTIEIALGPGLALVVEVATESALIRRSRGVMTLGGQVMEFVAEYDDFRTWNGILTASREEQYAMGQHTGTTFIDRVEYPGELPNGTFLP